jgi:hypothetical protein
MPCIRSKSLLGAAVNRLCRSTSFKLPVDTGVEPISACGHVLERLEPNTSVKIIICGNSVINPHSMHVYYVSIFVLATDQP